MWFKICIVSTLALATASAEAALARSGPYPASGWRPQKPFNLPGEFPSTSEFEAQQQTPQAVGIEISKERVDFVGQIQGNAFVATNEPQNAYLPPNDGGAGFLNAQQLPYDQRPQHFAPDRPQFVPPRPTRPQSQPQTQPQTLRPQQYFPAEQAKPSQQYGAPANEPIHIVYPEPRQLQSEDEADEENRAAVQALKAAVEAYNREQATNKAAGTDDDQSEGDSGYPAESSDGASFTQGQYYVLGADNALQRVMYTTSQDEEERRTNGFTAQLRYMPVGAVRDPIFRYNNRGQLVRILK